LPEQLAFCFGLREFAKMREQRQKRPKTCAQEPPRRTNEQRADPLSETFENSAAEALTEISVAMMKARKLKRNVRFYRRSEIHQQDYLRGGFFCARFGAALRLIRGYSTDLSSPPKNWDTIDSLASGDGQQEWPPLCL
jgi:hypothetical protein